MQTGQNQKIELNKQMDRPWGYYMVTSFGEGYQTKIIHVNPGQKLSVQSHNHRSEHWFVLSGEANVILDKKEIILHPGQSIDIPVKSIHSLQNLQKTDLEVIEIQTGEILSEEDIIRYSDIYGRV